MYLDIEYIQMHNKFKYLDLPKTIYNLNEVFLARWIRVGLSEVNH